VDLDTDGLAVSAEAGVNMGALEAWLNERGYISGHYPQSIDLAQVGGLIATRSAGQYSSRYGGIPVILAETNVGGPVEDRVAWFEQIVAQTRQARAAGVPIAGLTYYGAIDHVDWDTALRVRNLNINPCGMWSLEWRGDKLIRIPTALVDRYRQYIAAPLADTVGELADAEAAARVRAVLAPALGS
jgi:hypothetical protein